MILLSKKCGTQEKDAIRLNNISETKEFKNLPIYYMPIDVEFLNCGEKEFNDIIEKYMKRYFA